MCCLICKKFIFLNFSSNISYKSSIIKYDFWCFANDVEKINDEINEQTIVVIFNVSDVIFDVKIEKRDDFDAMIEHEIISTRNIDFRDVAIDVTNKIKKNEISKVDSWYVMNDMNNNVDSFDNENVAKNVFVSIVMIVTNSILDVNKNVNIAIIDFDVDFAISIDINFANFANFFAW